jgi:hypothetical protein
MNRQKIFSHFLLFIITIIQFQSCSGYYLLKPVSYKGEYSFKIDEYDLFIFSTDTIKINGLNDISETDNQSLYVFVELQINTENEKWENTASYFLIDSDTSIISPYNIRKFGTDNDSLEYGYSIMFYTGEYIKAPLIFQYKVDDKKNIVEFEFERYSEDS